MPAQKAVVDFLNELTTQSNIPEDLQQKARDLSHELGAKSILETDIWIYRSVVAILGTTVVATILGGLALAFFGSANYKLPAEIVAIGSAAVGALAGLLAPSPRQAPAADRP